MHFVEEGVLLLDEVKKAAARKRTHLSFLKISVGGCLSSVADEKREGACYTLLHFDEGTKGSLVGAQ
jgi:hypothetical protein